MSDEERRSGHFGVDNFVPIFRLKWQIQLIPMLNLFILKEKGAWEEVQQSLSEPGEEIRERASTPERRRTDRLDL